MATQTSGKYVNFDEFVEYQLEKARTSIRWTDLLTAAAGVAAMVLAYLLVFTILDHWVIPGGFGVVTRAIMLSLLVLCAGVWVAWRIVLPYMRRVNVLYAARELERAEPGLRYSLLNLVDLQRSGRPVPDDILRALQKRAAVRLSSMNVDESVDRRWLMRMSYLLLALVVACCLYSVFSPKQISFLRPLSTAQAAVATQTTIVDVRPGTTEVLAHSVLPVEVDLAGEIPETVLLRYTTADRKFVDETIELHPLEDGLMQFEGMLSGENGRGLLQDFSYFIVAGDARSDEFRVHVIQSPTAAVERVQLTFPDYMELGQREQTHGEIDTWAGASVALQAVSDQPVKSAKVLFYDDSNHDRHVNELRMDVTAGRQLSAEWTLEYQDGRYPSHYAIECRTDQGEATREPVLYSIVMHPDQAPEVFLDPAGDLRLPINATLPLAFRAEDPDFKLRRVTLVGRAGERRVLEKHFFDALSDEWQQTFPLTQYDVKLGELGMGAGDVLTLWVEARDNKPELGQIGRSHEVRVHLLPKIAQQRADALSEQQKKDQQERLEESDPEVIEEQSPQPQQESGGAGGEQGGEQGTSQTQDGEPEDEGGQAGQDASDNAASRAADSGAGQGGESHDATGGPSSPTQPSESQPDAESASDKPAPESGTEAGTEPSDSGQADGAESADSDADSERADHEEALRRLLEEQRQRDQAAQRQQQSEPSKDEADPSPSETQPEESQSAEPGQPDDQQAAEASDAATATPESPTQEPSQSTEPDKRPQADAPGSSPGQENAPQEQVPQTDDGEAGTPDGDPTPASQAAESTDPNSPGQQPETTTPAGQPEGTPEPDSQTSPDAASDATDDSPMDSQSSGAPEPTQSGEQPASEQQPADPSATGEATAQDDPSAQSTPTENPDQLSTPPDAAPPRTPADQADSPGDSATPQDAPDPQAEPGTASEPGQRPDGEGQNTQPSDARPSERQADPSQNPEAQRSDAPEGANEDLQGSGRPQGQSSEQPAGGEAGSGKQDDQGNSGSREQGPGETTRQPGDNSASGDPTGQPSAEPGTAREGESGSESSESESAKDGAAGEQSGQPGDSSGESTGPSGQPAGEGGESGSRQPDASQQQSEEPNSGNAPTEPERASDAEPAPQSEPSAEQGGAEPGGAENSEGSGSGKSPEGQPGGASAGTEPTSGGAAPGDRIGGEELQGGNGADGGDAVSQPDKANLEYTKKAAELVLKRLEDQLDRGDVDDELLRELGWTKGDLERFTERLRDQLYEEPGELTPESAARQRQFEETLRSFEIDAPGTRRADTYDRKQSRGGAAVRRIPVPAQYRERFEAFTRSVSKQNTKK